MLLLLLALHAAPPDLVTTCEALAGLAPQVDGLAAGDITTANALTGRLNALRTQLNRSTGKAEPEWRRCVDLSNRLVGVVQSRARLEKAAGERSLEAALTGVDAHELSTFERSMKSYEDKLERSDAVDLQKRGGMPGVVVALRTQLERVLAQEHPRVVEGRARIDAFEAKLQGQLASGQKTIEAKATALTLEGKALDAQLAELTALLPRDSIDCVLKPPFTEDRVRAWVAQLKQLETKQAQGSQGMAQATAAHPEAKNDPKLILLREWFAEEVPRRISGCIQRTATEGQWEGGGRQGAFRVAIAQAQRSSSPKELLEGAEAAEATALFEELYLGKSAAASRALAAQLRGKAGAAKEAGDAKLRARRMPEAASTDRALLSAAEVAIRAHGTRDWKRMVINAKLLHEKTTGEEVFERDGKTFLKRYPREYDWFQVTLAEQLNGHLHLVYYTLQNNQSGAAGARLGVWFVSQRIVSDELLEENLEK